MADLERFVGFSMLTEQRSKSMQRIKTAYMRALDLHSGDALFLAVLGKHPDGLSAASLARACGLDRAVVSRALPRLLEKGVIAYAARRAEKRGYGSLLLLTEAGRAVLSRMHAFTVDTVRHTSGDIPSEDLKTFYRVFRTIEKRLSEHAAELEENDCERNEL